MIQHFTVPNKGASLVFYDIRESSDNLSTLLKLQTVKDMFDTDEITALHNFNHLRNSLVHSSSYLSFSFMSKEYFEKVSQLIDEIDDIFVWLHKKLDAEITKKAF